MGPRPRTLKTHIRQLWGPLAKNFSDHHPFIFRYIILEVWLSMQNGIKIGLLSCGMCDKVWKLARLNMIIERSAFGGVQPIGKALLVKDLEAILTFFENGSPKMYQTCADILRLSLFSI